MSRPILLQEVEMGFSSSEDWMKSALPRPHSAHSRWPGCGCKKSGRDVVLRPEPKSRVGLLTHCATQAPPRVHHFFYIVLVVSLFWWQMEEFNGSHFLLLVIYFENNLSISPTVLITNSVFWWKTSAKSSVSAGATVVFFTCSLINSS